MKKAARAALVVALMDVRLVVALIARNRPDRAFRVATGSVAPTLCARVLVSGQVPQRAFAQNIEPLPGMHIGLRGLRYTVDTERLEVTVAWRGHFAGEAKWYPAYGGALPTTTPNATTLQVARAMVAPAPISELPVAASLDPALDAELTRAFAEPANGPRRHLHAIVAMHEGRVIAERCAAGVGPQTPQHGSVCRQCALARFAPNAIHLCR